MSFRISPARLETMLLEDAPYGDMTTLALGIGAQPGAATLRTGAALTVCCAEEAEALFLHAGCRHVRRFAASGDHLAAGADILVAEGPVAALQLAARTAQALMEVTSGVATRARRILQAARSGRPDISLACTRKHLPGSKDAMLKAIMVAGCTPHRFGLSESILVFAHHRAFLGAETPRDWIARLRAAQPERRIVVEAETVEDALLFAQSGADCVQLDRMTPEEVAAAVDAVAGINPRAAIAATGGINESNAAAYAATGVDMLVTSAPYFAPPLDVKVTMAPAASRP
ncbi:MAG TPA: ModD protein [Acidisphaera sp.]|nr:ModD protein [Acidisphaera sp.]